MIRDQMLLDIHHELIIDNFAGGGGASTGIEMALGRHVDIAINHDPEAVAMHQANHPQTRHYCESVWEVNPDEITNGRPIGLVWLSPDCKHFSKAKGGKPVEKKIRGLAWVALRWAARRPRVIMLENVEEFTTWGPLIVDGDGNTRPDPARKGQTFRSFVNALRSQGYTVEHRELRASDYGTPTIRKRLFLIARRDGQPIVWPEQTHGAPDTIDVQRGRLLTWNTAASCIDWSIPTPSIFERTRPLAEATQRRIAKGIMRYVVNAADPFIVPTAHFNGSTPVHNINQPLRTITANPKGGAFALAAPIISTYYGDKRASDVRGISMDQPLPTQTTENRHALVSAWLAKNFTGVVGAPITDPMHTVTSIDHHSYVTANLVHMGHGEGKNGQKRFSHGIRDVEVPLNTVTAQGMPAALVTSHLLKLRNNQYGQSCLAPLPTATAGGGHVGEVRAFLLKYYGADQDPRLNEPMHTVTSRDRFGLVTVAGQQYSIADIGLRMLSPRELYRAQGFPETYIIGDRPEQGLTLTKTAQVRMCGNSVCPPIAAALVRANLPELAAWHRTERQQMRAYA